MSSLLFLLKRLVNSRSRKTRDWNNRSIVSTGEVAISVLDRTKKQEGCLVYIEISTSREMYGLSKFRARDFQATCVFRLCLENVPDVVVPWPVHPRRTGRRRSKLGTINNASLVYLPLYKLAATHAMMRERERGKGFISAWAKLTLIANPEAGPLFREVAKVHANRLDGDAGLVLSNYIASVRCNRE